MPQQQQTTGAPYKPIKIHTLLYHLKLKPNKSIIVAVAKTGIADTFHPSNIAPNVRMRYTMDEKENPIQEVR